MKHMSKKGQPILEYVVVLTAIVVAIILAARSAIPGPVSDYVAGAAKLVENSAP